MELRIWVSVDGNPIEDERPEEYLVAVATNEVIKHSLTRASEVFQIEWEVIQNGSVVRASSPERITR